MPKNKLSIYLIKDEYTKDEEILKNIENLEKKEIDVGNFYYEESFSQTPKEILKKYTIISGKIWVKNCIFEQTL